MRGIGVLAVAAALAATTGWAQSEGPDANPPLSVWRQTETGLTHLQSGLACPSQFRGYRRVDAHVYDRFGLDVSCNYLDAGGSIVTAYVTRREHGSTADAMAEARREYMQAHADKHPQPISDMHPAAGGLAWDLALYRVEGGERDAIWIADLDGWTLEYRVTYRADDEGDVTADVGAFAAAAVGSAGAQLTLCGKSPPPVRTGVAAREKKDQGSDALMSAILGAAVQSAAADKPDEPPKPITWCAEQGFSGSQYDVLLWRGVLDDGADAKADRITAMSQAEPLALMAAENSALDLVRSEAKEGPAWEATTERNGRTSIWGDFTARPKPDALAGLYRDILSGKAHALSGYDASGKQIYITLPPSK